MTGAAIMAVRRGLAESREAFGARFGVSARTVEAWEQGLRSPHAAVEKSIARLAHPGAFPPWQPTDVLEPWPYPRRRPTADDYNRVVEIANRLAEANMRLRARLPTIRD